MSFLTEIFAAGALFFAQSNPLGNPTESEFFTWVKVAIAVLVIAALLKSIFGKQPPEHEKWADKKATHERFEKHERELIEIRVRQSKDKEELAEMIRDVPNETIALLKATKGLI